MKVEDTLICSNCKKPLLIMAKNPEQGTITFYMNKNGDILCVECYNKIFVKEIKNENS